MSTEQKVIKILRRVQASRRTTPQSLAVALLFAVEAILAAVILLAAYKAIGLNGYWWSLVSAILVLQPGVEQSFNTALVRIAANIIGALVGLGVGLMTGPQQGTEHFWPILAAIILVVFICELLRLDLGLRSACVSVIIVMTHEGTVVESSKERFVAVLAGCSLALVLQLIIERVLARMGWLPRVPAAKALPSKPVKENKDGDAE